MRAIGIIALPEPLIWTPHQLLSLAKEIDKICPEEGMLDQLANDRHPQTQNNTIHPIAV
jgi:hypothetical protein